MLALTHCIYRISNISVNGILMMHRLLFVIGVEYKLKSTRTSMSVTRSCSLLKWHSGVRGLCQGLGNRSNEIVPRGNWRKLNKNPPYRFLYSKSDWSLLLHFERDSIWWFSPSLRKNKKVLQAGHLLTESHRLTKPSVSGLLIQPLLFPYTTTPANNILPI